MTVTLASLRTQVRQRADMVHSQFVTDAELNTWINSSHRELRDLLVQAYGEDYYAAEKSYATDGVSDTLALPGDFYKLLGVDLLDGGRWRTLRRFNFSERNQNRETDGAAWWQRLRYRLRGNSLWFDRAPAAGLSVRLLYVPQAPDIGGGMDDDGSGVIVLNGVVAGDSLTGLLAYPDTEHEPHFEAGTGSVPGINYFDVGATDEHTAHNLALAIRMSEVVSKGIIGGATASGNEVTVSGLTPAFLVFAPGAKFLWFTGDPEDGDNGHIALGSGAAVDGINGWEEYIVVDCAAKALEKEESDPSAMFARKAALIQRIQSAAANRDAGEPARVVDVSRNDFGGW